jgi:hypothetical protein
MVRISQWLVFAILRFCSDSPFRNFDSLAEGMPIKGGPERGDLVIDFRVRRSTTTASSSWWCSDNRHHCTGLAVTLKPVKLIVFISTIEAGRSMSGVDTTFKCVIWRRARNYTSTVLWSKEVLRFQMVLLHFWSVQQWYSFYSKRMKSKRILPQYC